MTTLFCAALLGPVTSHASAVFACDADDIVRAILSFADDGYAVSNQIQEAVAMVMYMADNDPRFLTDEQRARVETAREGLPTRRLSLTSVGLELSLPKLFIYCPTALTEAQKLYLANIKLPTGLPVPFQIITPDDGDEGDKGGFVYDHTHPPRTPRRKGPAPGPLSLARAFGPWRSLISRQKPTIQVAYLRSSRHRGCFPGRAKFKRSSRERVCVM